jgi:hypothetical protein
MTTLRPDQITSQIKSESLFRIYYNGHWYRANERWRRIWSPYSDFIQGVTEMVLKAPDDEPAENLIAKMQEIRSSALPF